MYRRFSSIWIYFLLLSVIVHLGSTDESNSNESDQKEDSQDSITTTTTTISQFVVEKVVDSEEDSESETNTTTTTTTIISHEEPTEESTTTTTITTTTTTESSTLPIIEEPKKQFSTEYLLSVNFSSTSFADVTFNTDLDHLILLKFEEHEIVLINKNDGSLRKYFKYAHVIPIDHFSKQSTNLIVVFDENSQELWSFNGLIEHTSQISFKPQSIHIFSSDNSQWIAETSDHSALYLSSNSGHDWKKIDDSSSAVVLGWANKVNALVIHQYSQYIKLFDITTGQLTSILNDVIQSKLFSRYLLAKQLHENNSLSLSHVNNLADEGFRPLPKRLQNNGNFYCAVEDINSEDLLLLFITESGLTENNETIPAVCNVIGYSKEDRFNLSNIDCQSKTDEISKVPIKCSTQLIPLYQVRGLAKRVFLANVATGPSTVVSFDGGMTWNRTFYECDKKITCPTNASLLIESLISSDEAPGIIIGKATNGLNEYVAISTDAGQNWRLELTTKESQVAISNPHALIVHVSRDDQLTYNHTYRYSTDYGRQWRQGTFFNETFFQVLSLVGNDGNIFYLLASNNESQLILIELDFNLLITENCPRAQLKEWSLPNACQNGLKSFYKRRILGAHCLNNASLVRTESCLCSLSDFECTPGYRRSKEGFCLARSHYFNADDCGCHENRTVSTKRRGYVKTTENQCLDGVETFLSDAFVQRRDSNQPNLFFYGNDERNKRPIIEIHTNGFDHQETDENDDEDDEVEELIKNTIWSIDPTYEITAITFDETNKQVYMAVEQDQNSVVYRISKDLREQTRSSKQLSFDTNNQVYKSVDQRIEYLTVDWLTKNLYLLIRNKKTQQQNVVLIDLRTQKRRTLLKNQQIQPAVLIVDPLKSDLYWISRQSPYQFNIGNLQGQIEKQIVLSASESNISFVSYDPISQEILYVIDSKIYGLNTLDHRQLKPRLIYEHSSIIKNAIFIHPNLYFTNDFNETDSTPILLNAIDIVAKSFAKNLVRLKDFSSLKLSLNMFPTMPTSVAVNPCANNPCSDICIPLEYGQFRCVCSDDANYQTCSCPTAERFTAGSCQAKNDQCAPGRVLCQNGLNCAESALLCEQDHTQYTEAFKDSARCTLETANDGFDCFYTGPGIQRSNETCIPFSWLCDGVRDCPLGNDEDHCHKLTTTRKPPSATPNRCTTDQRFTHVMCQTRCLKINDLCKTASNSWSCPAEFHLHCKATNDKNKYVCKCRDPNINRCIAMVDECDSFEDCERVCADSIHFATSKMNESRKGETMIWIILIGAILLVLLILIILFTLRYRRQRKRNSSRTPPVDNETTNNTAAHDAHEKLLKSATPQANETS